MIWEIAGGIILAIIILNLMQYKGFWIIVGIGALLYVLFWAGIFIYYGNTKTTNIVSNATSSSSDSNNPNSPDSYLSSVSSSSPMLFYNGQLCAKGSIEGAKGCVCPTGTKFVDEEGCVSLNGSLPVTVGQCSITTVSKIGNRLSDVTGSGSAINYANGGYQVSYDTVQGIEDSRIGDEVGLCLISIPTGCPVGDARGKVYSATNLRTDEYWQAQDSEHSCGGM